MNALVWQVDPVVYNMLHEDPGNVSYSAVGGLSDQIRELRESIELPLMNPELFIRVGIKPPKVIMCFFEHIIKFEILLTVHQSYSIHSKIPFSVSFFSPYFYCCMHHVNLLVICPT